MKAFLQRGKRKSSPECPDEESTEVKLAILSSLHPQIHQDTLLDVLSAHDGVVADTSASLLSRPRPKPRDGGVGHQQSLRHFVLPGTEASPSRKRIKAKKGSTLHLYDPEDVAEHTPCTIIHNFLPPEDANALLRELLDEATSYEKSTFKLFENVVASPHTSSFYVESYDEIQAQKTDYHYNGARLSVRICPPTLHG